MTIKLTVVTVLTLALCATTSALASPYNWVRIIGLHGWVRSDPVLPSTHRGTHVPVVINHIARAVSGMRKHGKEPRAARKPAFFYSHSFTRDIANMNMAAVPDLDQDSIRIVQSALANKGFDPGHIDGRVGPRTRQAVRSFQDRYGMKANGEISNQLLFALGKVDIAIQTSGH
jgi:hypothetical protein